MYLSAESERGDERFLRIIIINIINTIFILLVFVKLKQQNLYHRPHSHPDSVPSRSSQVR